MYKLLSLAILVVNIESISSQLALHSVQNKMDFEVIAPKSEKHTGTLIFLHGATRTGKWQKEMFLNLLGEKASFDHIKIIFPTSPYQHFDLDNKMTNIWFNVKLPEEKGQLYLMDLPGITQSATSIKEIVEQEQRNGIPMNRTVVGGISQGAMVALHNVYRFNPEVAGCIAVSCMLPHEEIVLEAIKKRSSNAPLLQTHGEKDEIIPLSFARSTCNKLKEVGLDVEYQEFPEAPHELTKEELELIIKKVQQLLPEK